MTRSENLRLVSGGAVYSSPKVLASRRSILSMAHTMTPETIAAATGFDVEVIVLLIEQSGQKLPRWLVECHLTGRRWIARTERGAYLLAQIKGLSDWSMRLAKRDETA